MVGSRKQVGPQTVPGPWEWLHAGGKGTSGSGTWIPTEEAGGPPHICNGHMYQRPAGGTCEPGTPPHLRLHGSRGQGPGPDPSKAQSGLCGSTGLACFKDCSSVAVAPQTNWDRLGTLMLRSPMLMFRGISGRLMFFTADTARAGAAERPP